LKALRAQKIVPIQTFLVQKIVEDLEAALVQFREVAADLGGEATKENDIK
jgi:hypothetical protein